MIVIAVVLALGCGMWLGTKVEHLRSVPDAVDELLEMDRPKTEWATDWLRILGVEALHTSIHIHRSLKWLEVRLKDPRISHNARYRAECLRQAEQIATTGEIPVVTS